VVEGDTVTIFYDPMIAKLIVWDVDRGSALARLREALARCEIEGPKSNIGFLERLIRHPAIVDGSIDTGYLDRHLDEFLPQPQADETLLLAGAVATLLGQEARERERASRSADPTSPWSIADGWRLGHAGKRLLAFLHRGERIELTAQGSGGEYRVGRGDRMVSVSGASLADGVLQARFDAHARRFLLQLDDVRVLVHDGKRRLQLQPVGVYRRDDSGQGASDNRLQAPMPGRVVLVKARPGDRILAGQELLVIEAMKMELAVKAPRDGVVAEVRAAEGDFVEADAVLVTLEA
jgi:3-methylcrotonyl-CoA carboxylase alpha subunit